MKAAMPKAHKAASRPETTLFMLTSVDGKISTGDNDTLDFDKDLPKIAGVKEGLFQYYEIEQKTDLYSLNTGKVFQKIGINRPRRSVVKLPVSFVVIDNKPHLTEVGVRNALAKSKKLYIITTNPHHPAFRVMSENLEIIRFKKKIDFKNLFRILKNEVGISRLTIQSGGTLNSVLLKEGLIDHLSIIVAPVLIGGNDVPSLIDGESFHIPRDLKNIKSLRLRKAKILKHSYLHLLYDVMNK